MTVTLGTITLSDDLVLAGIETGARLAYSARRTLGGVNVVQVGAPLTSGRTLVLDSVNHLSLATVTLLKALEATGQQVTLSHHRGTFAVVVVSVEMEQDQDLANPDDEDADPWYSGTITMIEV